MANREGTLSPRIWREPALTRSYWQLVGGTLVPEFQVVDGTATSSPRRLDGLILLEGPFKVRRKRDVTVRDSHVIVVQTKPHRLDLTLLGQTFFGAELLRDRFQPASIRAVALCTCHDEALERMLARFPGIEVVVLKLGDEGNGESQAPVVDELKASPLEMPTSLVNLADIR